MKPLPANLAGRVEQIVRQVIDEMLPPYGERTVPIGISARHLHISQEHLEILFGPGAKLTKLRDLTQPGEFAAEETVAVMGPNRRLFGQVRILGPVREATQLELAYTDGIFLGMQLPCRMSGDIKGSAPFVVIGPAGVLRLPEGAIRAMRHIHMSPEDARRFGLKQGDKIKVKAYGTASLTFDDVVVRIKEGLILQMHIDTDEANAAGIDPHNAFGEMIF
ncbi:MAG: phosphate propanoyltransferase [candidate division KSB1 bacterium]|nr:phosphate propanoyltransferase [candidate division KSB1 bacterium]MDZ7346976.1 phosphate propanoyltransferase [candidate division KSB1 bacterium]MDZ7371036.1 phosphate propanoyltransferase [candidate division KSB1 bacterium]